MLMKMTEKNPRKTVLDSVTAMYYLCVHLVIQSHPPHLFNRLVPGNTMSYITVYLKCQCHYFICQYMF